LALSKENKKGPLRWSGELQHVESEYGFAHKEFVPEPYGVVGRILDIKGQCPSRHRVGEEYDFSLYKGGPYEKFTILRTPKVCPMLYAWLYPYILMLQFGGSYAWEEHGDRLVKICPDQDAQVVVELKRVRKEEKE